MTLILPSDDLAAIREAAWHAQAMGQLSNMMTTWRRAMKTSRRRDNQDDDSEGAPAIAAAEPSM